MPTDLPLWQGEMLKRESREEHERGAFLPQTAVGRKLGLYLLPPCAPQVREHPFCFSQLAVR